MSESKILTAREVAEIETREQRASRGPWSQSALANAYIVGPITEDFPVICALAEYNKDGTLHLEFANAENNMAFVSHAREDIPALCATVRHLLSENERLKRQRALSEDWRKAALDERDEIQSQFDNLQQRILRRK